MRMMKASCLAAFAVLCARVACATPTYWAAAYTEAYTDADTTEGGKTDAYSGYYCTVTEAGSLFSSSDAQNAFSGGVTVENMTTYLATHFDECVAVLSTGAAKSLEIRDYTQGQYGLKTAYGAPMAGSSYLALLFYADEEGNRAVRVMANDPGMLTGKQRALFDDNPLGSDGANTPWTVAAAPEPTGGTLLLFGLAVLALKRRRT